MLQIIKSCANIVCPELIDQPLNGVTVMRIYAAVAYRLTLWEPRISLSSVNLNRDASGAVSLVLQGLTNGTSDDIPAWLSNEKFVVNAASTASNRSLLEATHHMRK
ncbi:UNVERIFIED_ORG: hypothetical protein DFO49_4020 [Herbaspirillum seropedicae]